MPNKLDTRGPLQSDPLVNVRGEEGQYFIGVLVGSREVDCGYGKKPVYEFTVKDTDMSIQRKEGKEYKETTVDVGDKVCVFAGTRLAYALSQAKTGQVIKIVYRGLGEKPKRGGNRPHEYDVEVL